jgi:inosine-uridine nucleoside N-ribohydrolase
VPPSVRLGGAGDPQHDACAAAWLVAPGLFTARDVPVEVDLGPGPGRGRTLVDRWGRLGCAPNARLLESLDADGSFALLGERIGAV